MSVLLENPLVLLADLVVPLILALLACLRWGPNRGVLYAVAPTILIVFGLFFLQVSPGTNPDGSTRFDSALGYMMDEGILWVASFLVGAAIGSVLWKRRVA